MSKARQLAELGAVYDSGALSNRNLIINGAMQVAQRGTSVTAETGSAYRTCDRFYIENNGSTYDAEQWSDAPSGFEYSQKITLDGAFTATGTQFIIPFEYRMEGNELQRFKFGTSDAESMTLSFWIKSSKTGTYVIDFTNNDATTRTKSQSYTVDSADTWEYKTITITGDTTTAFPSGIAGGLTIFWWMICGSDYSSGTLATSWENQTAANRAVGVSSSGADNDYWAITGVQLEVGSEATPFEHRSYGDELARCQRYYYQIAGNDRLVGYGFAWNSNEVNVELQLPQVMRATPTVGFSNNTNDFVFSPYDAYFSTFTSSQFWAEDIGMRINLFKSGGGFSNPITQGQAGYIRMMNNTTSKITVDAEL